MMKKLFCIPLCIAFTFLVPVIARARLPVKSGEIKFSGVNTTRFNLVINFGDTSLLPLTLVEFHVRQVGYNCCLTWKAVREEYSTGYTIERSVDGKTYTVAGKTMGPGTEIGMQQYSFTDYGAANLGARIIFYRLKLVDAQGQAEFTHVIAVTVNNNGSFVNIFPNPAADQANLQVHVLQEERLGWILTDLSGRTLKSGEPRISAGASNINLNLKGLMPGIYYLQLKSTSLNSQLKLVKL